MHKRLKVEDCIEVVKKATSVRCTEYVSVDHIPVLDQVFPYKAF